MATRYNYTGSEQTFTVATSGYYTIDAVAAGGSGGNRYGTSYTAAGGKGARLVGTYALRAGEKIHVIVGGVGTCVQATARDGSSGGGGGYTMVTREIPAVVDSRFQFVKNGQAFEVLLLVAGGGGSQDCAYRGGSDTGTNGNASSYWHPDNYKSPSTTTCSASSYTSSVLSVQQYISQNAVGTKYTRSNGIAQGGYGGGGAADDSRTYGGGWASYASYTAGSWSVNPSATGTDGYNSGNGYCTFTYLSSFTGTMYYGVSGKARKVKNIYIGVSGKARKVKAAYYGVGGIARRIYKAGS